MNGKVKSILEALNSNGEWIHYDLDKSNAEGFKQYLRDNNIYFEPSSNGELIHFEVLCKSDEAHNAIRDYIDSLTVNEAKNDNVSIDELAKKLTDTALEFVKNWGYDDLDDANVEIKVEKFDDHTIIRCLSEFDYEDADLLCTELDKVLNTNGYGDSYFEAEDAGIWDCYIWK